MSGVLSTRVDKVCCTVYKSGQGLVYFLQEWSRSGVLSTRVDKVWCPVFKSGQGLVYCLQEWSRWSTWSALLRGATRSC